MRKGIYWLPREIQTEILARLPVGTVLRCNCVCKKWLSLTQDTQFLSLHDTHRTISHQKVILISTFGLLIFNPDDGPTLNPQPWVDPSGDHGEDQLVILNLKITGSCNGLICFSFERRRYVLANPSNVSYRELPNPPNSCFSDHAVDGFGYDSYSNDFIVVRVVTKPTADHPFLLQFRLQLVQVFSLKLNLWINVENVPRINVYQSGVFLNGAIHWFAEHFENVVALSLPSLDHQLIPLPDLGTYTSLRSIRLDVSQGCLSISMVRDSEFLEFWLMREYGVGDSWTKILCIDLSGYCHPENIRSLCMLKDGKVLIQRFAPPFSEHDPEIVEYDPVKNSHRNFRSGGLPSRHNNTFDVFRAIVYEDMDSLWRGEMMEDEEESKKRRRLNREKERPSNDKHGISGSHRSHFLLIGVDLGQSCHIYAFSLYVYTDKSLDLWMDGFGLNPVCTIGEKSNNSGFRLNPSDRSPPEGEANGKELSLEEEDLLHRSTKKVKDNDGVKRPTCPRSYCSSARLKFMDEKFKVARGGLAEQGLELGLGKGKALVGSSTGQGSSQENMGPKIQLRQQMYDRQHVSTLRQAGASRDQLKISHNSNQNQTRPTALTKGMTFIPQVLGNTVTTETLNFYGFKGGGSFYVTAKHKWNLLRRIFCLHQWQWMH
ncbi:F-box domain [Dillenia turbinata]|uniref:F-box domain n=1 Tax=Dillenia turbinata TaxID=194707 RepID=A0AAN8UQH7_9MAGN